MGYIEANPNPEGKIVDDCVIRSLSIALDMDWESVYAKLSVLGLMYHDIMTANYVWAKMLEENGFRKFIIPDTCPDCYTIKQFVKDNPSGVYVLGTGQHAVAVKDGSYYDTFDSGDYSHICCWVKV